MITDKERDLIAAQELALEYEKRSLAVGPDHRWLVMTAIGRGRALAEREILRLRMLVADAYAEGFDVATGQPTGLVDGWLHSETRAALNPKEPK
jgi:hypothetical protein